MRRAKKFNKPVHAFAGKILGEKATLQGKLGLATLHQISPDDVPIEEAMRDAEAFLLKGIRDYFPAKTTKE